jgi:hypothetical protein
VFLTKRPDRQNHHTLFFRELVDQHIAASVFEFQSGSVSQELSNLFGCFPDTSRFMDEFVVFHDGIDAPRQVSIRV